MNSDDLILLAPQPRPWVEALRDETCAEMLLPDDFDLCRLLAELVAASLLPNWTVRAFIALHCAPLLKPDPHTWTTAVMHHHGFPRSEERARIHYSLTFRAMIDLYELALAAAVAERVSAEERFRKAVSGALLRRQPSSSAMQAGCKAAAFCLTKDRAEEMLAEEAAWWMRRRADA